MMRGPEMHQRHRIRLPVDDSNDPETVGAGGGFASVTDLAACISEEIANRFRSRTYLSMSPSLQVQPVQRQPSA